MDEQKLRRFGILIDERLDSPEQLLGALDAVEHHQNESPPGRVGQKSLGQGIIFHRGTRGFHAFRSRQHVGHLPPVDGAKPLHRDIMAFAFRRSHPFGGRLPPPLLIRTRGKGGADGCAHPKTLAWQVPRRASKFLKLNARGTARAHELDLVDDPQGIDVDQSERDRPMVGLHRVPAVQRAGEKHVLGAHEHRLSFRVALPFRSLLAPHQPKHRYVVAEPVRSIGGGRRPSQPVQVGEPLDCVSVYLLHERAHRQAIDESSGRISPNVLVGALSSAPRPCKHRRRRLPAPGGHGENIRQARRGGELDLVLVRPPFQPCRHLKEVRERATAQFVPPLPTPLS